MVQEGWRFGWKRQMWVSPLCVETMPQGFGREDRTGTGRIAHLHALAAAFTSVIPFEEYNFRVTGCGFPKTRGGQRARVQTRHSS